MRIKGMTENSQMFKSSFVYFFRQRMVLLYHNSIYIPLDILKDDIIILYLLYQCLQWARNCVLHIHIHLY